MSRCVSRFKPMIGSLGLGGLGWDVALAADARLPGLPREKWREYDPNGFHLFFPDHGNYDRRSGLSK